MTHLQRLWPDKQAGEGLRNDRLGLRPPPVGTYKAQRRYLALITPETMAELPTTMSIGKLTRLVNRGVVAQRDAPAPPAPPDL